MVFVFLYYLCVLSLVRLCVLSLRVVFRSLCAVFVCCLCVLSVCCLCVPFLCVVLSCLFVIFVFQYMSFSRRYKVDVVPSYRLSVGVIVSHVSICLSVAEIVGSQGRVARRPVALARTQPSYRLSRLRAFLSCRPGSW